MRRIFTCFILTALLFAECGFQPPKLPDEYILGQDDQFYFSWSSGQSAAQFMAETSDGYYFLSGPYSLYLYYMDKKIMKPVILCNKPDCLHTDETDMRKIPSCNAFMADKHDHLIYYDSHLYVGGVDSFTNTYSIYQISLDGTEKKKFYTFEECMPEAWIMHRGFIYFVTNDNGTVQGQEATTQSTCTLYRIGLNELRGEPSLIGKIGMVHAFTGDFFGYGNNIYWHVAGIDAALTKNIWQAFRFDISGEKVDLLDEDVSRIIGVCGGKLVFLCADGISYMSNLDGSNKERIGKITEYNGMIYSDGHRYLFIDSIPSIYDRDKGETTRRIHVYDLQGNLVKTCDIDSLGRDICYGGNGDYIFIPDTMSASNQYGDIQILWAIDEKTLGNANPDIIKIFEFVPRSQFTGWATPLQ